MVFEYVEEKIQALRNIVGSDQLVEEIQKRDEIIAMLRSESRKNDESHQQELHNKDLIIQRLEQELTKEKQRRIKFNKKKYTKEEFELLVEAKFNQKQLKRIKDSTVELYNKNIDALVQKEIDRYPNGRLETKRVVDTQARKQVDEILYDKSKWPEEFCAYFNSEVRLEADRLKTREYYAKLESDTANRLETLRNGAWRDYIEAFWRNRLTPFLRNSLQNQIISLQEVFDVVCPKCDNIISFRLTPDNLRSLVLGRPVGVICAYCRGFFGPTKFNINLADVFWLLTDRYQSTIHEPRQIEGKRIFKVKRARARLMSPNTQ